MMFGALGQHRPRRVDPHHPPPRSTPGSTSSTPPTSTRAASPRRSSARRCRGRRDDVVLATKVHGTMGDDPNQAGNSRRWIVQRGREQPAAPADRLDRPLPDPPPRAGHRHRRDARRADRPRRARARSATSAPRRSRPSQIVEAQWVARAPRPRALRVRAAAVLDPRPRRSRPTCCPTCARYGMGVIPWSPLGRRLAVRDAAARAPSEPTSRARRRMLPAALRPDCRRTSASSRRSTRSRELADEAGHAR